LDNVKRIWSYFKGHKIEFAFAIAASLLVAGGDGAFAYIIKDVLDGIFIAKDKTMLMVIPPVIAVIMFVRGGSRFVQLYLLRTISLKAIRKIRGQMYSKMLRFPMSYYDNTDTGSMMSRIMNDVTLMQTSVTSMIRILKEIFSIIFLTGVIFYMDYELALYCLIIIPSMAIIISKAGQKSKKYSKRGQERMEELATVLSETFSGIRVVKGFVTEDKEEARFKVVNYNEMKYQLKKVLVESLSSPILEIIAGMAGALIIFVGGFKVINGGYTAGTFMSFLTAFLLLMEPFKRINKENGNIQAALSAAERVFALLDKENHILDNDGTEECDARNKVIELKDVKFRYNETDEDVLNGLNLTVQPGQTVAFVGSSGAGKTTLVSLIPRFYDVTDGSVRIGDKDIRDFQVYSLRSNIAVVNQEPFLFNDTITENIRYGTDECTDEDIKKAAESAYAIDFINDLSDGFNTLIGERGDRLSGGQRQRLTIARALLNNPPILILDEATSSLDTEAEKIVQKALHNLMKGRTSFVIAHRLSTILDADMIVVLDKGKVEATGTHDELLGRSKIYKKLYEMQFRTEVE